MLRAIASRRRSARTWVTGLLAAVLLGAAAITAGPAAAAAPPKPTVVLVHGSYADASSWSAVVRGLQKRGFPVIAAANPLRGVSIDSAYLQDLLAQIEGLKALVYVAAFAPDQGETLQQLISHAPGSLLTPSAIEVRTYRTPDGQIAPEGTINPSAFRRIFAADLPASLTEVVAASQRPTALSTLTDPSGPPAWTTIPSWYLVAGADKAVGAANERFMAQRIHATTVEVKGASHVVMISRPAKVAKLIVDAAAGRR